MQSGAYLAAPARTRPAPSAAAARFLTPGASERLRRRPHDERVRLGCRRRFPDPFRPVAAPVRGAVSETARNRCRCARSGTVSQPGRLVPPSSHPCESNLLEVRSAQSRPDGPEPRWGAVPGLTIVCRVDILRRIALAGGVNQGVNPPEDGGFEGRELAAR